MQDTWYRYSLEAWLYIHKRSWHTKRDLVSRGGGRCHTRVLVFGEGGMKVTSYQNVIRLTYLRSVLIFIKQYSDSMCFSSIFSLKLRIIPYLCEIDVPPFGPNKNVINSNLVSKLVINCSRMNSSIIWYPFFIQNYPHILQNRRLKTGSICGIGVAVPWKNYMPTSTSTRSYVSCPKSS